MKNEVNGKRTKLISIFEYHRNEKEIFAFIPVSQIKQSANGKTEYFDTYVEAKNQNRLVRRNISKRAIAYHLIKSISMAGFPYKIYFFPEIWNMYCITFHRI